MCVAVIRMMTPSGLREVPCKKCWQCSEDRINDMVGRNIAESKTSTGSFFITLTYGRNKAGDADHPHARWLFYSDVQKYFKRLRWDGYEFRYFVAGEYGSLNGRAHWHPIIHFKGKIPPHVLDQEQSYQEHWTDGYSQWSKLTYKGARYACKYITGPDEKFHTQTKTGMSRHPPLGTEYFKRLAWQYAQAGLAPQSNIGKKRTDRKAPQLLVYKFQEIQVRRNDELKTAEFILRGKALAHMLDEYVKAWEEIHGARPMPNSELLEEYLDPPETTGDVRAIDAKLEQARRDGRSQRLKQLPTQRGEIWDDYYEFNDEIEGNAPDGETIKRQAERAEYARNIYAKLQQANAKAANGEKAGTFEAEQREVFTGGKKL